MAIGDKIFQLSMGIIQAERQRKQLALQTDALEQRQKQADALLQLREQQLAAKEGFLSIQQQQLQLQADAAARKGPEAELKMELTRAEIELKKAQTQKALRDEKPDAATASAQRTAGLIKSATDTTARGSRTAAYFAGLLAGDAGTMAAVAPRGVQVNNDLLRAGLVASNATTLKGMQDALESAEKDLRTLISAPTFLPEQQGRLRAAESKKQQIEQGLIEAQKVFMPAPSREEFLNAAEGSIPAEFAQSLYDDVVPAGAMREQIWGGAVNTAQYEVSIRQLLNKDLSVFTGFLRSQPGTVLTTEGVFRPPSAPNAADGGAAQLGQLLIAEGVPEATIRQLIGDMSRASAQ